MTAPQFPDLSGLVFLRREAIDRGYTDHQIARLVKRGEWHRVRRGAYVAAEVWQSLGTRDQHRLRNRAVLRTAHPSAVLTHTSAALEWGAPVWGVPLGETHVTRTDGKGGRREAGVVHHRGLLPSDHVRTVNDVPVSSPTRCAVEMTAIARVEPALVTVNGLLGAGLTNPEAVATLAKDLRYWPSSLGANLVARLADPRVESPGESRAAYFFWANHLPRPVPQVEIYDESGRLVGRVDFALPEYGVFVEFDGREKYHRHRRDGETLEQYLMREKAREELICQLTGWICIRITWADLDRPQELAGRIRRLLRSRHSDGTQGADDA